MTTLLHTRSNAPATFARVALPGLQRHIRIAALGSGQLGPGVSLDAAVGALRAVESAGCAALLLSGDAAGDAAGLDRLSALLAGLACPVLATLGRRDHRLGAERVQAALEGVGVEVLRNRWASLPSGALAVYGLDDVASARQDPTPAQRRRRWPAIGLTHHPRGADLLWELGLPLVLSGPDRASAGWLHAEGRQLHCDPGTRGAPILDLVPGVVSEPIVRPWDAWSLRRAG